MATWLTSPFESSESGNIVIGSIRKDVDKFRKNPRFKFRVEVSWAYSPSTKGMPDEQVSELMEQVEESLNETFGKDPVAVMTEIYTGEGVRDYVFYTLSLHIFQKKFNESMAGFPQLPLSFSAEEDPLWKEHAGMLSIAQAADDDNPDTPDN